MMHPSRLYRHQTTIVQRTDQSPLQHPETQDKVEQHSVMLIIPLYSVGRYKE